MGKVVKPGTGSEDFILDEVDVADINATGTPDATTALYGDGTWKIVNSDINVDGGSAASVYLSSQQLDGGSA